MNKKIKVLVVPSDTFGVGFYRSVGPHTMLDEMYRDDFDVEISYNPNWADLSSFDQYDIIHFHKGVYNDMETFWKALDYFKEHNIVTIMDIDDNWDVGPQHPMYASQKAYKIPEKIVTNLKKVDYVTTTTPIFAEKIKKHNPNVLVFPNGINPEDEQYSSEKNPSKRIRVGFVMGSAHEKDMEQIKNMVPQLAASGLLDKIQIVLCGYDLKGTMSIVDPRTGQVTSTRPIRPEESVWYSYEKTVTNDYKIVSPEYEKFLKMFLPNSQYPNVENEPYRREWTKPVNEFAKHYRNLDILLAPLECNSFNEVKSELKFIEAGFTRTAVIATDFGPYTIGSKNMFEYGGNINMEGNCVLIDPGKKHKAWAKAIKKLVDNPELIKTLQDNMYETVKEKYDIHNITADRAEWYKRITKK